jgi:hypothetical protein
MCELPVPGSVFSTFRYDTAKADANLLGLPAFNPGEKVEIDLGMDDI